MKLLRCNCSTEPVTLARLGVLLRGDLVGDMRAGYARYLVKKKGDGQGREVPSLRMQPGIAAFLAIGSLGWDAAIATQDLKRCQFTAMTVALALKPVRAPDPSQGPVGGNHQPPVPAFWYRSADHSRRSNSSGHHRPARQG